MICRWERGALEVFPFIGNFTFSWIGFGAEQPTHSGPQLPGNQRLPVWCLLVGSFSLSFATWKTKRIHVPFGSQEAQQQGVEAVGRTYTWSSDAYRQGVGYGHHGRTGQKTQGWQLTEATWHISARPFLGDVCIWSTAWLLLVALFSRYYIIVMVIHFSFLSNECEFSSFLGIFPIVVENCYVCVCMYIRIYSLVALAAC